ncbi:hypothetical protein [Caballeronia zhejiangensis]|nr:hypothetical protein [Caballeronia zhejiangensis]
MMIVEGDHPINAYAGSNLHKKEIEVRFTPLEHPDCDGEDLRKRTG